MRGGYYGRVFSESLRVRCPVQVSTSLVVSEDVVINGCLIKKGIPIAIHMNGLHKDPS